MDKFQNKLKEGHFNESICQKPPLSLEEVVTKVESYIKGEERNTEKKTHDVKECVPNSEDSHQQNKSNYTSP